MSTRKNHLIHQIILLLTIIVTAGCLRAPDPVIDLPLPSTTDITQNTAAPFIPTETPILTNTITPTIPTPTATLTLTPISEGCREPSQDNDIIEINGHRINQRTFAMLKYAQSLYNGEIDIVGNAITQGSYTTAVEASFGTHAGGGAVDLSVMAPGTYTILEDDIEPLIHALRRAGFAAWYRDLDELHRGSPTHIHAIAIGDRTLSLAAREQLAGPFGYFWGYNGLPTEDKKPIRDPYGGPIICDWMIALGYPNKTATPSPEE